MSANPLVTCDECGVRLRSVVLWYLPRERGAPVRHVGLPKGWGVAFGVPMCGHCLPRAAGRQERRKERATRAAAASPPGKRLRWEKVYAGAWRSTDGAYEVWIQERSRGEPGSWAASRTETRSRDPGGRPATWLGESFFDRRDAIRACEEDRAKRSK